MERANGPKEKILETHPKKRYKSLEKPSRLGDLYTTAYCWFLFGVGVGLYFTVATGSCVLGAVDKYDQWRVKRFIQKHRSG